MPNTYKNKVVYNGTTLIDLTADTVTPSALMQGYTAHDKSGALITGTATGGIDGDDLAYGGAYVGTAIVGIAEIYEPALVGTAIVGSASLSE